MRIDQLWRGVVGWAGSVWAAVVAAGFGVLAAVGVLALGLAGPVAAIYTGRNFRPARVVLAALVGVLTPLAAERLWRRIRPLRLPAYLVMVRQSNLPPNTFVLNYGVLGQAGFVAKHALIQAGFEYVEWTCAPGNPPELATQLNARICLDPSSGFGQAEAQASAEKALKQRNVKFRLVGSSGPTS